MNASFKHFLAAIDWDSRKQTPFFVVTLLTLWLVGCAKEPISITTIPKERENTAYITPSHWIAQQGGAMRAATFNISDEHGHNGEVSVLPMPRLNIADIEIVNLWRQQVGLPPAEPEEVSELAEAVAIGDQEGNLFDLLSPDASTDADHAPRIMTAYLHDEAMTWFFKLTGPNHIVESEEAAFREFLASMNLRRLEQDFQRRRAAQAPPPTGPTAPPDLPEWESPEDWTQGDPSSSMTLATFSVSTEIDGPADVTVSAFGGGAGGLSLNINRWRGQVGLSPVSDTEIESLVRPLDLGEREGTFTDMAGEGKRIVAAIVPVGGRTWFFKMMGSPETVESQIGAFTTFVQSVRYSGDG